MLLLIIGGEMSVRILLCGVNGLGEEAISRSFNRLDYDVNIYDRKCDNYDTDKGYMHNLVEYMQKEKPDIVFSIDFLPIVSKVCQIFKIIYISWIYDCPEIRLYSSAVSNLVNKIFLFDKIQYERFHRRSPNTVYYMPLATEPVKDFENWITKEEKKWYTHNLTFVGSLYNEKRRQYHELEKLDAYDWGFVNGLARAQTNVYGYNFIYDSLSDDMVSTLKRKLDYASIDDYVIEDREVLADQYIGAYASALDRVMTLQAAADVNTLHIYTDSDVSQLHNVINCGVADSVKTTPKIFHCSRINLNMTSKTIQSGIPLRVFDVLGVGGFLITNYQPEIVEYFKPGEDLVVYEDIKDMQDKIKYYLEHEEERSAIARHGYETICNNYTYDIMLKKIFEIAGVI